MPAPTRDDLKLNDTPALALIERRKNGLEGVNAERIAAVQHVLRCAKRMLAGFADHFDRHGLTPGRYSVLTTLKAAREPLAPSEIARRVGVRRPTMTGLLTGLASEGLVEQVASASDDQRRKAYRLTLRGHGRVRTVLPKTLEAMERLTAPFDDAELAQLVALAARLESGLDGMDSQGGRS